MTWTGCDVCGAPTRARCRRCSARSYCGTECQRIDWEAVHRRVCQRVDKAVGQIARREFIKNQDFIKRNDGEHQALFNAAGQMSQQGIPRTPFDSLRGVRAVTNIDVAVPGELRTWTWLEASNGCWYAPWEKSDGTVSTAFEYLSDFTDEAERVELQGVHFEFAQRLNAIYSKSARLALEVHCGGDWTKRRLIAVRFWDSTQSLERHPGQNVLEALRADMDSRYILHLTGDVNLERGPGESILDDSFWEACLEPVEVATLQKREVRAAGDLVAARVVGAESPTLLLDAARDACVSVVRAVQVSLNAGDVGPCAATALLVARCYRTIAAVDLERSSSGSLVEAHKCCATALFDPVCAWVHLGLEPDARSLLAELFNLRHDVRTRLAEETNFPFPPLPPVPADGRVALYCPAYSSGESPALNEWPLESCVPSDESPPEWLVLPEALESYQLNPRKASLSMLRSRQAIYCPPNSLREGPNDENERSEEISRMLESARCEVERTRRAPRGRSKGKDRKNKTKGPGAADCGASVCGAFGAANHACGICFRSRPMFAHPGQRDVMEAPVIVCRQRHAMCADCATVWRRILGCCTICRDAM